MLLGGEALIFERVELNPSAKLLQFVDNFFSRSSGRVSNPYPFGGAAADNPIAQPRFGDAGFNSNRPQSIRSALPAAQASFSGSSRFGPSRFAGPARGGYGGPRTRFGGNANGDAPRRFASAPVRQASSNSILAPRAGQSEDGFFSPVVRELLIKDWMPWSLIAVGGGIFLYTHTSGRR